MLSIIIPSYKDPYLQKTIDSLLKNAERKIEIIPVLDGYIPERPIKLNPRVKPVILPKNLGMRGAINTGIKMAKGKFIMKCDSHCMFAKGFDKIMTQNCKENWLMVPRRYSLDENKWEITEGRPYRDYHYLTFPEWVRGYGVCITPQDWLRRGRERNDPKYDIDDIMTFQGSCWFANRKHFKKRVGFLDDRLETYGPFGGEQIEIGLKYWLKGDEVKVIKKTWYAHLSKQPRHYKEGIFEHGYKNDTSERRTWAAKHWMGNNEPGTTQTLSWLIEKFWPVPTWPEDRKLWVFPK